MVKDRQNGAFEKKSQENGGHVEANDFKSCWEIDADSGTEIDVMMLKAENYQMGCPAGYCMASSEP